MEKTGISPIGKTATEGAAKRAARSAAYRAAHDRHAESKAIAKQIIHLRTIMGISQQQLAKLVGTSYSQISRIESGRHQISHGSFRRIYRALGATPLIGYELPATKNREKQQELVAV